MIIDWKESIFRIEYLNIGDTFEKDGSVFMRIYGDNAAGVSAVDLQSGMTHTIKRDREVRMLPAKVVVL